MDFIQNRRILFILCGPSGVGKGTLIKKLLESDTRVVRCPCWTTRPLRSGEVDSLEYHYTNLGNFIELQKQGDLIGGSVELLGYMYGVRISEIEKIWKYGQSVLVESNFTGIKQLREHFRNVAAIFIAPPSLAVLAERLNSRKRENQKEISLRFSQAQQMLSKVNPSLVDYYIVNDDIQSCLYTLQSIIHSEYHRLRSKPSVFGNQEIVLPHFR